MILSRTRRLSRSNRRTAIRGISSCREEQVMKTLIILVDYRGQFWLKTTHKEANFDLPFLKEAFEHLGYNVTIQQFSQIDFKNVNYKGKYILYQSSEDPELLYNSFIED